MTRALALAALLTALLPGVARGAPWRWPVPGRIVGAFSVSAADPFAAGQRRGIAIRSAPGAPVGAVCAGRVAFAGSVGRAGPTVSVVCGALRATYQGLATVAVRTGDGVAAGVRVATLEAGGVLRLGARLEGARARHAAGMGGAGLPAGLPRYVDPARLLGAEPPQPPLGPAPGRLGRPRIPRDPPAAPRPGWTASRAPASRLVRAPTAPRSLRVPAPARAHAAAGAAAPSGSAAAGAPLVAWVGLALLAAATPVGALWRRGVRSREGARRQAPVTGDVYGA